MKSSMKLVLRLFLTLVVGFSAYPAIAVPTADAGGPYFGSVNAPLAFDGSGSFADPGVTIYYSWDFNNSGFFLPYTLSQGVSPTYSFSLPGLYPICLRVSDDINNAHGSTQDCTTAEIGVHSPVASAGGPYFVYPGQTISLDASGSFERDGLALTYAWDFFGNGLFTDSALVNPTFSVDSITPPGTDFTACVKVSNLAKSSIACAVIDVQQRIPEPASLVLVAIGLLGLRFNRRCNT